jgi:hypothetical protein
VRLFPDGIFPNWGDTQLSLLTTAGFYIDYSDTAHYIALDSPWRDAWRRNRSRDFKKSESRICGFQIATDRELSELYDVITKNVEQKNLGLLKINQKEFGPSVYFLDSQLPNQ